MRKTRKLPAAALLVLSGTGGVCLGAGPEYTVTDLGTLFSGWSSQALGINDNGQVVGGAYTGSAISGVKEYPFLWTASGGMQNLMPAEGIAAGYFGCATGINNDGVVVGQQGAAVPFLWTAGDGMRYVGMAPGNRALVGGRVSINNAGQVAGQYFNGSLNLAILVSPPSMWVGIWQDLGDGHPYAINDNGQVVGQYNNHAFQFIGRTDLGTLGGAQSTATGINNSGQVVGWANKSDNSTHAFLWNAGGTMQDLGTFGTGDSQANAINNSGQVVGQANGDAFLWTSGGGMQDLNGLIGSNAQWSLTEADAINDLGQIVGTGINSAGQTHGFLLTPASFNPPTTLHFLNAAGGSFDASINWTLGILPTPVHDIVIDPVGSIIVSGPTGSTTIKTLILGAQSAGATADLQLNSLLGALTVSNTATVQATGQVEVNVGSFSASTMVNDGSITVNGRTTVNGSSITYFRGQVSAETLTNGGSITVNTLGQVSVSTLTNQGALTVNGNLGLYIAGQVVADALINEGTITVNGNGQIGAGTLTNRGTIHVYGGLTATDSTQSVNQGNLTVHAGGTLNVQNGVANGLLNQGTLTVDGGLIEGTVTNDVAGTMMDNGLATLQMLTNHGAVTVNAYAQAAVGTLTNSGTFAVNADAQATVGTLSNTGTFAVNADGQVSVGTFANRGTLHVYGSLSATDSAQSVNQGNLTVHAGSTLDIQNGVANGLLNQGTLTQDGGLIEGTVTNDTSGTMAANGTLYGELSNYGLLELVGGLEVDAGVENYGTLATVLAGTNRSVDFGALDIMGPLICGGTLQVTLADGYVPQVGDTFNLFSAGGGFSGTFGTLDLPALTGETWDTSSLYITGDISVIPSVVPEPATMCLLAVGGIGLLVRRRRG